MFNNLIESSSHAREFKRRGSFLLFTIAAYSLLFVCGGVASIYAYDAHLDEQETAVVVTMVPSIPTEAPKPVRETQSVRTSHEANLHSGFDERRNPTANVSQPIVPATVSTKPNPELPVRPDHPWQGGNRDVDAAALPGGNNDRSGNRTHNSGPLAIEMEEPPPPPPLKKQVPQIIKQSDLNRKALELPKPAYPALAIKIQLSGQVSVQVLIDETGRVVSAHAVSGHPILAPGAVKAAYQARFSPMTIGDTPVKVSGIINYNFVLQ